MEYTQLYYELLGQLKKDEMQRRALESKGNTVVLAGPGSGKTSVLTLKATGTLEKLCEPYGIACITYGREASIEMEQRIYSYGVNRQRRLFIGTIHSFCVSKILAPFGEMFEVRLPYPLKVATSSQRERAFKKAKEITEGSDSIGEANMNTERSNRVGKLSSIRPPSYDVALKTAIAYEQIIHSQGIIDYEDIINYSVQLMQERDYVRDSLSARFPWILIDEYQDLGKPLHEIVLSLLSFTSINLFIVGDPDQSIYSFTGANPGYMYELLQSGKFDKVVLENNYRSPQGIIDASIHVLGQPREYYAASDKHGEATFDFVECDNGWEDQFEFIARSVIPKYDTEGIPREEIAVVIKHHDQINACRGILEGHGIKCYVSKLGFDRTRLINWLESCAAWSANSSSVPFVDLFMTWCNNFDTNDTFDPMDPRSIIVFRGIIEAASQKSNLAEWVDVLIEQLNIPSIVSFDEQENLRRFQTLVRSEEFEEYTIDMFSKIGKPSKQVVLLTWFAVKGLEFEAVILTGMDEGFMPDYKATKDPEKLREQSRMCFVGVSRAKKHCILLRSKQYTIFSTRYGKYYTHPYRSSRYWDALIEKYGGLKHNT
jgi:DNA helicase-2/ATP-dependent DNA helicase PcrA